MNDKQRVKQTASVFFDHFGISPVKSDMDSLRIIVSQFSRIPWENLTKFLRKAQLLPTENRLRLADTVIREHIENGAGGTHYGTHFHSFTNLTEVDLSSKTARIM